MTPRPDQPEPFLRGAPYPGFGDVPYPRADPVDSARLPADVWQASVVPVGVRIEMVGDADAVDIAYRTTNSNFGYRGDGAGVTFAVWRNGEQVAEEEAVLGEGTVRLSLGSAAPDKLAVVYLPEGMHPIILSVTPVNGEIIPPPPVPRWIAYGDSVTQGWVASSPSRTWTAIASRKADLDLVNLGYAGSARGEIVSAEHLAGLPADVITVAYGASCWSRTPHSAGMVAEGLWGFLGMVRYSRPATPIVVISPLLQPDAEDSPNKLGSSLTDLRRAIESATRRRIDDGDVALQLIEGRGVLTEEHLDDGIHPGDEGHRRIAAVVAKALIASLKSSAEPS